jgi:glycosyltransferase involved in cell wall biosynthesis
MRIIYLHQYFITPHMAGGTRSYEMARRLVAWGHEVHLVTSWQEKTDKHGWFKTDEAGIQVHWIPVSYSNHMNYYKRIKSFIKFAYMAARKSASIPGDVVFATSTPLTIALPAVFASRRQKIPMVFEVRDLWPQLPIAIGALRNPIIKWGARLLERFAYKNAKHIVALSPGMADGIYETGYSSGSISVIPNSSDLELFEPDVNKAKKFRQNHLELGDGPIVLYPGTLGKINGVEYMAYLAARVQLMRPDCRFVVIGDGAEVEHVKKTAFKLNILSQNFFMYPQVSKHKLVEAFCDATIVTSLFIDLVEMEANSANKFFDGLASGTPIAINYGGWQADLIKQHEAGLVLPRDISKAAIMLVDFLNSPQRIIHAGIQARKLAETQFSRDILAKKLEDVLINATGRKN